VWSGAPLMPRTVGTWSRRWITASANINDAELARTSDAVAHAVLTFAQTTSAVNGTDNGATSSTKPFDWKGDHRVR
jgi:hypothetical protein